MLKSADPDFCPFSNHLPASFLNIFESISDLKVISGQSWGHREALWDIFSVLLIDILSVTWAPQCPGRVVLINIWYWTWSWKGLTSIGDCTIATPSGPNFYNFSILLPPGNLKPSIFETFLGNRCFKNSLWGWKYTIFIKNGQNRSIPGVLIWPLWPQFWPFFKSVKSQRSKIT